MLLMPRTAALFVQPHFAFKRDSTFENRVRRGGSRGATTG